MFTVLIDENFVGQERSWLADADFKLATSAAELEDYVGPVLEAGGDLGLDYEATGLNIWTDKIVGMGVSRGMVMSPEGRPRYSGMYYPVRHFEGAEHNLPIPPLIDICQKIDAAPNVTQWWFNADYDLGIAENDWHWTPTFGKWRDAMIGVYLEYSDAPSHGLKASARRLLQREMIEYTEALGLGRRKGAPLPGFEVVHPLDAPNYACADPLFTVLLGQLQPVQKAIKEQSFIWALEHKVLGPVRAGIEHGIPLDGLYLRALHARTLHELRRLEAEIKGQLGVDGAFNLRARAKLGQQLVAAGVPLTQKTDSGQIATKKGVLSRYAKKYPVCASLVQFAELGAADNNYTKKLVRGREHFGVKVRIPFNTTGAPTGRMSSGGAGKKFEEAARKGYVNSNGQSIPDPEKQPYLPDIRAGISVAELDTDEYVIVAMDYSQVELRIVGNVAKEKLWEKMFREGIDIHAGNAALIEGIPVDKVTKAQRKKGKISSFAIVYQATPKTVAEQAGITEPEAETLINTVLGKCQGINRWIQQTKAFVEGNGYVQTPFGRRRILKGYFAPDRKYATAAARRLRNAGHREGVNAPIQGGAADVFKISIYKVHKALKSFGAERDWIPIMWVHDEMVSLVRRSRLYELMPKVKEVMEFEVRGWAIPLKVDVEVGWNWGAGKTPEEEDQRPSPFPRNWGAGLVPWETWAARFPPETAETPVVCWLPGRYYSIDAAESAASEAEDEDSLDDLFDDEEESDVGV